MLKPIDDFNKKPINPESALVIMFFIFSLFLCASAALADGKHNPAPGFDAMNAEEQKEFDGIVDGLINEVCGYDARLAFAQASIDKQKKIQALTGTANLVELNNAGAVIVDVTPLRQQRLDVYKKVMGKDLKGYECD
jgi:hypothetical protein